MLDREEPVISGRDATHRSRAFTLVEILIVVVILGILAAIAVPKLSNASQMARESTLKDDCRFLRTQIIVYQNQHNGVYPGYPAGNPAQTPTEADFLAQLTSYTDDTGNTSSNPSTVFKNGPYLTRMPENPINSLTSVKIIAPAGTMTPDGSTGWVYQPVTGAIVPNLVGTDSDSKSFVKY